VGDPVRVEYFLWEEPGRLVTREAEFELVAIVPARAVDQDYVPPHRGISDAPTLDAWDPPFPIDLSRIRPADEAYWDQYRTAPKAFVPLEAGQRLWGSRFGNLTSVRFDVLEGQPVDQTSRDFRARLDSKIDPQAFGMAVSDVRGAALAASQGATDFGEYFLYFSFFLVVSALVLAALFFKLGVEQRVREIGLLRAVGLEARTIRRLLTAEALALALIGALIGAAGAVGYAWLVIVGLRTIWVDAVGTTSLTLHVSPGSLIAGALGGVLAATACTWWTLRGLGKISERSLLAGETTSAYPAGLTSRGDIRPTSLLAAAACGALAVALAALGALDVVSRAAAFFGAGVLMLVAGLFAVAHACLVRPRHVLSGRGWRPIARLGFRNAAGRPGRSVLAIGVIASAAFLLISVDAFRRGEHIGDDIHSGVGGYDLMVESLLPVAQDLNSAEARLDLNLAELEGSSTAAFRLRPGDDASCLNLYVPQSPRILGAPVQFIDQGRFAFRDSLAETDEERANPWRLLQKPLEEDVIPVAADATSMTYVLKRQLGDDIAIDVGGREVRLRLVAALADSLFQRELVMAEDQFRRLFPDREGYQVWLIDAPAGTAPVLSDAIENALADHGADVVSTAARLAEFHRVENTYLSTFQTLGGLGLLLGTLGLGAVLLRNALERRRELALLGAVGYRRRHFLLMLAAESASLLLAGLAVGGAAAALAVAPALYDSGARLPVSATGLVLLALVFVAGLLSTLVAARVATRAPLLQALRSE
jgi:ABC-type antimicrobial peptide transport system permease subunit